MHRKDFLTSSGLLLAGIPLGNLGVSVSGHPNLSQLTAMKGTLNPDTFKDEAYWKAVRDMFNFPKDFINLENGYFSPQPFSTEQFHQSKEHYINHKSSWFMRVEQAGVIEKTRAELSEFLGFPPEELAITRNTTESLNTIISGYPWQQGDEVIIGNQDYGSMVAAFRQQAKRKGIEIKTAMVPLLPSKDEEVIHAYISLITPKTKVLHLTHLINLSGQLLPAKKIIDSAHEKGVEVIVDAAHSVAHIDFKPGELDADYIGASLHKWLCCPLGAGLLYVKRKHIEKIWPLMGDDEFPSDNIRKFEHQGTRPIQTIQAIAEAIKFHELIGSRLKEDRLYYLKSYWVNKIKDIPGIVINTPATKDRSGAIANISIKNYTPNQVAETLMKDFKIFTVAINHPAINGTRITPHLYTSLEDLDKLTEAIQTMST